MDGVARPADAKAMAWQGGMSERKAGESRLLIYLALDIINKR